VPPMLVPIVIIGSTIVETVELTVVVVPLTVKSPVRTKLPPTFKLPVIPTPPETIKAPDEVLFELVSFPTLVSTGTTNNDDVKDTPLPTNNDWLAAGLSILDKAKKLVPESV